MKRLILLILATFLVAYLKTEIGYNASELVRAFGAGIDWRFEVYKFAPFALLAVVIAIIFGTRKRIEYRWRSRDDLDGNIVNTIKVAREISTYAEMTDAAGDRSSLDFDRIDEVVERAIAVHNRLAKAGFIVRSTND